MASCIPFRSIRHRVGWCLKKKHIVNCINEYPDVFAIMFHSCSDINLVNQLWKKHYIKRSQPKFLLMSHSLVLPARELQEQADYHHEVIDFERLKKDDINALLLADVVVAPSQNAMNSYWKELPVLLSKKKFRYITTGCAPLKYYDKTILRQKYNIKTKFVICYVGRHWKVKGYDRLVHIASHILQKRSDVTFLIGGEQNPAIKPLSHPRWVELGWVDSVEVFCCSDVFLMPNRESYFDLVIPEALSIGLKCVLSNVGGNIDFNRMCSNIGLFSSDAEAMEMIDAYLSLSEDERNRVSEELKECYQNQFNLEKFADSYIEFSETLGK